VYTSIAICLGIGYEHRVECYLYREIKFLITSSFDDAFKLCTHLVHVFKLSILALKLTFEIYGRDDEIVFSFMESTSSSTKKMHPMSSLRPTPATHQCACGARRGDAHRCTACVGPMMAGWVEERDTIDFRVGEAECGLSAAACAPVLE
jgi:hypothetical protein